MSFAFYEVESNLRRLVVAVEVPGIINEENPPILLDAPLLTKLGLLTSAYFMKTLVNESSN